MTGIRGRRRNQLPDDIQNREDTVKRNKKCLLALCGKLVVENSMDLSLRKTTERASE